ncbi:MAG: TolC family outer membrane protein [Alphaproteobacteria bacterium]|nr:TolC family outer membrane protein [Alphaproteobacteria bacterium]
MKRTTKKTLLLTAAASAFLLAAPAHAETLTQAMVSAYQTNPGLAAQRAQLRATDEQASQAESNWRPRVRGITSIGKLYTYTPDNALLSPHGGHTPKAMGLEIVQPIFRGFRTDSAVDSAEKQIDASRALLKAAEQKLLFDVGRTYLDVLRDQATVALYLHNQDVLTLRQTETQKRFAIGDATRTDVLQAQARLDGVKTGLAEAQGKLENDTAAYARYVGHAPKDLVEPKLETEPFKTLDETVDAAVRNNPAIIAGEADEDKANADIDLSKGTLLPEIDLVGSATRAWDQSDFIPGQQDSTAVMLRMTIPLYNAGEDYSRTREAQQTATAKRMQLDDIRLAVRQSAVGGWNALQTARAAIASSKAQADADALALEGVKKEASAGTRTVLDILNAQQELLAAKVAYIQAQHDEAVALLRVRAAVGDLTARALKLPAKLYDPQKNYDEVKDKLIGFADAQ